jgi:elongation factor 1-gamma
MVVGTLYTNRDNFRAHKIRVAAKYAGKELDLHENVDQIVEKVPALEVKTSNGSNVGLNQSLAIAYFVSDDDLKGGNCELVRAEVLQWLCFADNDLLPVIFNHVFPILEVMARPSEEAAAKTNKEVLRLLGSIDKHLKAKTFLVGERITLADISLCCNLILLFERGLLKDDRDRFVYLMRWFNTIINQKNVNAIIGSISLCKKLEPLPQIESPKSIEGLEFAYITSLSWFFN